MFRIVSDTQVDGSLQDKSGREVWEEKFSSVYLQPVLQDLNNQLDDAHARILQDHRIGMEYAIWVNISGNHDLSIKGVI